MGPVIFQYSDRCRCGGLTNSPAGTVRRGSKRAHWYKAGTDPKVTNCLESLWTLPLLNISGEPCALQDMLSEMIMYIMILLYKTTHQKLVFMTAFPFAGHIDVRSNEQGN